MPRTPAQPGVDRRQRILEAALDAFAEHGFEGATTTQIAANAGATQGLIYFYFPKGKDELFTAAFNLHAEETFGELDLAPLLSSGEPPDVILRQVVERFLAILGSHRCLSLTRVLWRTMANTAGHEQLSAARSCGMTHLQRIISQLSDFLAAESAAGRLHVENADATANLLVGGMLMLMRMGQEEGEPTEARRATLAREVAAVYIHGVLPALAPVPATPALLR